MSYAVITIPARGPVTKISQPKAPDLTQLQTLIGGYIERVPYFHKFSHDGILYTRGQAWADEDGLMKRLPHNILASASFGWSQFDYPTNLYGTIIFYAKERP